MINHKLMKIYEHDEWGPDFFHVTRADNPFSEERYTVESNPWKSLWLAKVWLECRDILKDYENEVIKFNANELFLSTENYKAEFVDEMNSYRFTCRHRYNTYKTEERAYHLTINNIKKKICIPRDIKYYDFTPPRTTPVELVNFIRSINFLLRFHS